MELFHNALQRERIPKHLFFVFLRAKAEKKMFPPNLPPTYKSVLYILTPVCWAWTHYHNKPLMEWMKWWWTKAHSRPVKARALKRKLQNNKPVVCIIWFYQLAVIMWIRYRKEIRNLTFRALAFRRSESDESYSQANLSFETEAF